MKIAILDDYQDCVRTLECFSMLEGHEVKVFTNSARGLGQLSIRLTPFDVIVAIRERTRFSAALLKKLPNLKLIAQTGRVGAHINLEAATAQRILVCEGASDPNAPAELTWALIMAATRKLPQYIANLKLGLWQASSLQQSRNTLGFALKDRTLGIWGYGKVGRLVAGYGLAFGMRVLVWGSETSRKEARQNGCVAAQSKQQLFEESDVLSLHLRLHDTSRGCVTLDDLMRMQLHALIVNTSRAELIAPGALEAALAQGRPGMAALDVFADEPLAPVSPLLKMEQVLATPHLGFVEKESYEHYFSAAFQNILNFAAGTPTNMVNPAAIEQT